MIVSLKKSVRRKAMFAAALASLLLSVAGSAAFAQAAAPAVQQQSVAQVQDEVRNVLTQYGRFVQHAKYGEVWVPTVTPQGWHPYPPCNWVNTKKYGWYYDDKTAWGQIVHHYGRWVSDPQMGWIWTPGAEFSPGWVVWRIRRPGTCSSWPTAEAATAIDPDCGTWPSNSLPTSWRCGLLSVIFRPGPVSGTRSSTECSATLPRTGEGAL